MDEEEQRWQDSGVRDESVEKTALVSKDSTEEDSEVYSSKRFFKARSFKLGLIISLIVLIVVTVIAITIIATMAGLYSRRSKSRLNVLTLDDVFDSKFSSKFYSGSWLSNQIVTMTTERGVTLYDPSNERQRTLISAEELESLGERLGGVFRVELSPSFLSGGEEVMVLAANRKQVYRHSSLADYYLYSLASSPPTLRNVTKPAGVSSQFQYLTWSPDGNYLAYVIDYNIYVVEVGGDESPVPITQGGSKSGVVFGIPDWVYEEEVFATDYALWWSPDSQRLLFVGFDDSQVEPYSFPVYGSSEEQYTTTETISYPKPGTPNPVVTVYVKNISDPEGNVTLLPGPMTAPTEHYLAYAGWFSGDHVELGWLNRDQTLLEFCRYRLEDDPVQCDQAYHQSVPNGWVEQYGVSNFVLFEAEGGRDSLLVLHPQVVAEDSYTHLFLRTVETDESVYLTGPGTWEVTDIVGRTAQRILYISAEESPLHRHLYSYSFPSGQSTCLSCDQSNWNLPSSPNPSLPESCDYFSVSCDQELRHCLLNCLGPCVPYTVLARYDQQGEVLVEVKVMEGNAALRDAVSSVDLPTSETISVPEDESSPVLNGMLLKPPGFDARLKYPVLVYVYGGPNSQVVSAQTMLFSLSRLWWVSNLSLVLASVDGRGTGLRGDNFKFTVYKNLGDLETVDQNRAGQYLQTLSYVDGEKMAIYGSSYGGYMAGRVGSSGSGVFSAAISQSPVSDWHYYDTIYTERYMLTPDQNREAYQVSSILPRAAQLADVDYLLIHGTGDDNVHYQHTAQLAEALSEADVQFRMQVYTDKDHSLVGGNTRRHLYQLIADFLRESFQL